MSEYRQTLTLPPAEALATVSEVAEAWGAEWQPGINGGRLRLPIAAGLRLGEANARVSVEPAASGSLIVLEVEETHWRIRQPAVVVLTLGALGALVVTLWPFYPPLLALAPVALIFTTVAWLLVVSRLRTSGPEDFLELLEPTPMRRDRLPRQRECSPTPLSYNRCRLVGSLPNVR